MVMALVKLETDVGLAIVTLDNPPQNRISPQLSDEFAEIVDTIEASNARAVLLRADGPDFSFGGDITNWPDMSTRQLRTAFDRHMAEFNRFERLPLPVVAAVQGLCFGGGLELVIRADVIFAGESARFGHPEQSLGIATMLGGIYRVAERAGRAFASEWALTSEQVPAATMMRHGVINHVVPDADLEQAARKFAERAAKGPTRAYAAHKALLRVWAEAGVATADTAMFDIAMPLFETDDVRRGIPSAVNALRSGQPRPVLDFTGR
jgi:enoyl-CoA hydratase/carnithine racemase